jgi:hypothetical protein
MTLVWQPGYAGLDDPDAAAYITNVEAADLAAGQSGGLEDEVKLAIHDFVKGCKNDGIWPALKASCILAGAKTLAGALVPLVKQPADSAPARFGTEGGWNYNRETGLQGNGTNNYINSGRANNADPQNSNHNSYYASSVQTGTDSKQIMGDSLGSTGANNIRTASSNSVYFVQNRTNTGVAPGISVAGSEDFFGVARSSDSSISVRVNNTSTPVASTSQVTSTSNIFIFSGGSGYSNARLAFYSIGESLNLALLDTRVSALITAIGAAIP